MTSSKSRTATPTLITILCIASLIGLMPAAMAGDAYPSDAVVARFTIDPATLSAVNNTVELIDVLHQELKLEAASPLNYEVIVHLLGNVYQGRDQQPHSEGSGVMLSLEKGKVLDDRIRDLRFYTYGDFSESEAWDSFRDRIQTALLYSMNSSGSFEADEDGTVWLTVADVVDGTVNIEPDGNSMVLELTAELNYRDGSRFGLKEAPEGYRQIVQTVQLVLAPAEVPVTAEPEPEQPAMSDSAPAAVTESGGITGVYGYDASGLQIEMKDGKYVMFDIRKSPPEYMPLTSIGENHFSVDYYGEPAKLKFSLDDDGNAFAMSVEQQGHEIKLPRKL